jgi:hypothetical protein
MTLTVTLALKSASDQPLSCRAVVTAALPLGISLRSIRLTRRLWATVLLSVKLEIKGVSSLISTMGITNPRRGTDCTHLVLTSQNVPKCLWGSEAPLRRCHLVSVRAAARQDAGDDDRVLFRVEHDQRSPVPYFSAATRERS